MGGRDAADRDPETVASTAPAGEQAAEIGAMDAVAGDAGEAVDRAHAAENEGSGTERHGSTGSVPTSADPPAPAGPLDDTAATTAPAGEQAADLAAPEAVAGDPDDAVSEAKNRR